MESELIRAFKSQVRWVSYYRVSCISSQVIYRYTQR